MKKIGSEGFVYIVLFTDLTLKVGRSARPLRRIAKHRSDKEIKHFNISNKCPDMREAEKVLISNAFDVSDGIFQGREYFIGSEDIYNKISDHINKIAESVSRSNRSSSDKITLKDTAELMGINTLQVHNLIKHDPLCPKPFRVKHYGKFFFNREEIKKYLRHRNANKKWWWGYYER